MSKNSKKNIRPVSLYTIQFLIYCLVVQVLFPLLSKTYKSFLFHLYSTLILCKAPFSLIAKKCVEETSLYFSPLSFYTLPTFFFSFLIFFLIMKNLPRHCSGTDKSFSVHLSNQRLFSDFEKYFSSLALSAPSSLFSGLGNLWKPSLSRLAYQKEMILPLHLFPIANFEDKKWGS